MDRQRTDHRFARRLSWKALLCALSCLLLQGLGEREARARDHFIRGGRERDVLALVAPIALGGEVIPGWRLANVVVDRALIRYELAGPGGARASLTLEHPDARWDGERSRSFVFTPAGDPLPAAALSERIRENDAGTFWAVEAKPSSPNPARAGPPTSFAARPFPEDGLLALLLALGVLAYFLKRELRGAPVWLAAALFAVTALGAVLRWFMAVPAPMEAFPYARFYPLARLVYEGPVLHELSRRFGLTFSVHGTLAATNWFVASLTPLVLFAHARLVLRDQRSALVAAALLAVLPSHVRFSQSDVAFIQSLASSSLTFVALYTALSAESRVARGLAFAVVLPLSLATYCSRPENFVFVALDAGAIWVVRRQTTPPRIVLAGVLVAAASAFGLLTFIVPQYLGNVEQGFDLGTLGKALGVLVDPRLNTLINPHVTPPGLVPLALWGGVVLYRGGERERSLFLTLWLLTFFVVHSYVVAPVPAMQARYHLHLLTPLVLLAAAATPALLTRALWQRAAVAAYFALSPWLHRAFVRDTHFTEMEEYAFLRDRVVPRIPEGCTVIEYRGLAHPDRAELEPSRLTRLARRLRAGEDRVPFTIVDAGAVALPGDGRSSPAAAELLERRPECLLYYEGLACFARTTPAERSARACRSLHEQAELETVVTERVLVRTYDPVQLGPLQAERFAEHPAPPLLRDGQPLELKLERVLRRR